jgi:hypothetical protein
VGIPRRCDHFSDVIAKAAEAADEPFGVDVRNLAAVTAPTLVVTADDDIVALSHTVEMYQTLPRAALAGSHTPPTYCYTNTPPP